MLRDFQRILRAVYSKKCLSYNNSKEIYYADNHAAHG